MSQKTIAVEVEDGVAEEVEAVAHHSVAQIHSVTHVERVLAPSHHALVGNNKIIGVSQ
jgi:hypothetical protein